MQATFQQIQVAADRQMMGVSLEEYHSEEVLLKLPPPQVRARARARGSAVGPGPLLPESSARSRRTWHATRAAHTPVDMCACVRTPTPVLDAPAGG